MDLNQNENNILKLIKHSSTRERGYKLLVSRYSQMIYWQVRRMVLSHDDADDLVQEIFIKIFENIENTLVFLLFISLVKPFENKTNC